jgi:hypothetical protein
MMDNYMVVFNKDALLPLNIPHLGVFCIQLE